jgi:hypothetical protein
MLRLFSRKSVDYFTFRSEGCIKQPPYKMY